MSTWFLVLTFVLVALAVSSLLAEWLASRYTLWTRPRLPFSAREEWDNSGDPFDPGNRPGRSAPRKKPFSYTALVCI